MKLDIISRNIKEGDLISHTVCSGGLQEHVFTGWKGDFLCGMPTFETMHYDGCFYESHNILPDNVTHINRVAVDSLDFLVDKHQRARINTA